MTSTRISAEQCVPSFCVFACRTRSSQHQQPAPRRLGGNVWNERQGHRFPHQGPSHRRLDHCGGEADRTDCDTSYAYRHTLRKRIAACLHQHDPISTIGPCRVPVPPGRGVSCELLRLVGEIARARLDGAPKPATPNPEPLVDPPGPNPRRCFDMAAQSRRPVGRPLAGRSWIASESSWSARLPERRNHYLRFSRQRPATAPLRRAGLGQAGALARADHGADRGCRAAELPDELGVPRRRDACAQQLQ